MQGGWDDILGPGERVVWQDRPDTRLQLTVRNPMEFGLGLALSFGPITPCLLLFLGGSPLWMAGLPVMALGLWFLVGWCVWDTLRRRATWYSLSTRRAFRATALGRRTLADIPLAPGTDIETDPHVPDRVTFRCDGHADLVFGALRDPRRLTDLAQRIRAGTLP